MQLQEKIYMGNQVNKTLSRRTKRIIKKILFLEKKAKPASNANKYSTPQPKKAPAQNFNQTHIMQKTSVRELIAVLERSTEGPDQHTSAARLVALAPMSVANAAQIFNALEKIDMLSMFSIYFNRMSEETQNTPHMRMCKAACLASSGNMAAAIPLMRQSLMSSNGFTITGAGFKVLSDNFDVKKEFDSAMAEISSGQFTKDTLVFALLIAQQNKCVEWQEQILTLAQAYPKTQHDPQLLFLTARVARSLGNFDAAADHIFKANDLAPNEGLIGAAAVEMGRLCPSDKWLEPAIAVGEKIRHEIKNPNIVKQILIALARLYHRHEDPQLALEMLEVLQKHAETNDDTHPPFMAIARSQIALGAPNAAYDTLDRYAQRHPSNTEVLYNMAGVLAASNKVDDAIALINARLPSSMQTEETHAIIGHIYAWSGQTDLAKPLLKQVLQNSPNHASAQADLSLCSEFDREYTLAFSLADKAAAHFIIKGMPSTIGIEFMQLARLRRRMMFLADMAGDERMARAMQREAITTAPLALPYHIREWSDQDLAGKSVISLAELGIGDEIRYTCVLHHITQVASHVTLSCDPRLQGLLERSFPNVNVVPVVREFPGTLSRRTDNRTLGVTEAMRKIMTDELIEQGRDTDIWMRGRHFFESQCLDRSRLHQSPIKAVLHPDPALQTSYAQQLQDQAKGRKVVGLSWRGGRRTYNREPHYFELEQWAPLFEDQNLCFVNLQYALLDEELEWLRANLGDRFIEFPELDLFDDMEGVAALCRSLDLVVAICTAVLELACAVNTPCLYLMRSPQVTHAIRFSGHPDINGAYQDAVWASCRIIPRFKMTDRHLIEQGRDYMTTYFSSNS
jgi:tetratricopeptide (TPR) repeat protein